MSSAFSILITSWWKHTVNTNYVQSVAPHWKRMQLFIRLHKWNTSSSAVKNVTFAETVTDCNNSSWLDGKLKKNIIDLPNT